MNEAKAYAELTTAGYVGKFKLAWRTAAYTVNKNGKPAYFKSATAAECAAWRAKHQIEQTTMYRDGVTLSDSRNSELARVFSKGVFANE